MNNPSEIDVRGLSQPTLARMVMLYLSALHDHTEQVNRITREFMTKNLVEHETMRSVTTTIDTIHQCLSDDVNMLIAQDESRSN